MDQPEDVYKIICNAINLFSGYLLSIAFIGICCIYVIYKKYLRSSSSKPCLHVIYEQ